MQKLPQKVEFLKESNPRKNMNRCKKKPSSWLNILRFEPSKIFVYIFFSFSNQPPNFLLWWLDLQNHNKNQPY